ncbi:cytochrome P450 [Sphingobium sp. DC-2]|uniref:cytochrome P450 n=1 Tax=Sphingobium sp. DC-2 TaxID=1303256 RepID=UPI00138E33FE|nr:cytochrome P450 [Sphingobium sp. DC-2]
MVTTEYARKATAAPDPAEIPYITSDPLNREAILNATAVDKEIQAAGPMVWLDHHKMWATARYDLVKAILQDWETFSSAQRPFESPDIPIPQIAVSEDPPSHTDTRRALNWILAPAVIRTLKSDFEAAARAAVDRVVDAKGIDIVEGLVRPYIFKVFGDAMGLRPDGRENLSLFGAAAINAFGPTTDFMIQFFEEAREAAVWVQGQCNPEALAPGSIGARVFEAADRGDMTHDRAATLVLALLTAGTDTTIGVLTNMFYGFSQFPDQWTVLRNNPDLALSAFEEGHRWLSPGRWLGRVAVRDTELAGAHIHKGDPVLIFATMANRDPTVWDEPDRFDITRKFGKHLSFGTGIHNCAGQMLAREEAVALIRAMAEKIERIELAGEPEVMISAFQTFDHLPMNFHAAS